MAKVAVLWLLLLATFTKCYVETRIVREGRDIQRDIPQNPSKDEVVAQIPIKIDEDKLTPTTSTVDEPTTSTNSLKAVDINNNEDEDSLFQPEGRVLYRGSQLWKTIVDSEEKAKILAKLRDEEDITMWGGNVSAIDILVKRDSIGKVRSLLNNENIRFDVAISDLQQAIDEENPPLEEGDFDNRNGHRLTWQAYHRLDDIHKYLDFLEEQHPDLVSLQTIGKSVKGNPIRLIKISNKQPGNKAVFIDGGIHAREWITPATVTYIINQLISNWENEPKYIQNTDWYFAPLINPDGYEYTHTVDRLWRKNRRGSGSCAGVDLNRNFGYRWGGSGASKNPCAETYGGSGPFSEPETAAVQNFMSKANAKWKAYISFHSYGQYILYPWGYNRVVPPDYKDLELVGQKAAQAIRNAGGPSYTVGPAGNTLYPAAGGSDDWAKGAMKIKYAYTVELRDNGRYGFVLPASYIQPTAKEAMAAVRVIVEAANKA